MISDFGLLAYSVVSPVILLHADTIRAAERGGLEGQAALGAKKRGAPKSGGREKKTEIKK